jgi:hypothetical protein
MFYFLRASLVQLCNNTKINREKERMKYNKNKNKKAGRSHKIFAGRYRKEDSE